MITSGNHYLLQVQPEADTFSLSEAKSLARSPLLASGEFSGFIEGLNDTGCGGERETKREKPEAKSRAEKRTEEGKKKARRKKTRALPPH